MDLKERTIISFNDYTRESDSYKDFILLDYVNKNQISKRHLEIFVQKLESIQNCETFYGNPIEGLKIALADLDVVWDEKTTKIFYRDYLMKDFSIDFNIIENFIGRKVVHSKDGFEMLGVVVNQETKSNSLILTIEFDSHFKFPYDNSRYQYLYKNCGFSNSGLKFVD